MMSTETEFPDIHQEEYQSMTSSSSSGKKKAYQ